MFVYNKHKNDVRKGGEADDLQTVKTYTGPQFALGVQPHDASGTRRHAAQPKTKTAAKKETDTRYAGDRGT